MKQNCIWLICFLICGLAKAQTSEEISPSDFLDALSTHPYVTKQSDELLLANAELEVAKISPDPSLEFGNVSGDISGIDMPNQWFLGVGYTLETGGKRRQRIEMAKAQMKLAGMEHEVFVNHFKCEGLKVYQQCWMLQTRIREHEQLLTAIQEMQTTDPANLKQQLTIMEIRQRCNDMRAEHSVANEELNELVDHIYGSRYIIPDSCIWCGDETLQRRSGEDLEARAMNASIALMRKEILLSEKNRAPDVSFVVGNNFVTQATNLEAPSPRYNAITATVSLPLKFSNWRGAERKMESIRTAMVDRKEETMHEESEGKWRTSEKEIQRLSEAFQQYSAMIALQEKIIATTSTADVVQRIEELRRLAELKEKRWETLESISRQKAQWFEWGGVQASAISGTQK